MSEADWLALCVYMEARGEIADGRAAVAKVILNRTADLYASTGTIESTVTWPSQFSWCEWDWQLVVDPKTKVRSRRYVRICSGPAAIRERARNLLADADPAQLTSCRGVAELVRAGKYRGGAGYAALTRDTVLYANLALASPGWALKVPRATTIGHHAFYRDPTALRTGITPPRPPAALLLTPSAPDGHDALVAAAS